MFWAEKIRLFKLSRPNLIVVYFLKNFYNAYVQDLILNLTALFVSSFFSVVITYYKVPPNILQEIVASLIVILLVFFKKLVFPGAPPLASKGRAFLIFFIALFLQLLILSTGGFLSPFIILFHLFAIGLIFLLSFQTSLIFLAFSLAALIANTRLDKKLFTLFIDDPWSVILSGLSFIIFIPLYQLVASRYNFKGLISDLLERHIKLSSSREQSLLSGLSDLVIMTDRDLKITSVNEAAVKILGNSPSQLQGRSLADILFLAHSENIRMDQVMNLVNQVLTKKTVQIANDLLVYTRNALLPKKFNMQISPVADDEGKVCQLMFILSIVSFSSANSSLSIRALGKHEQLIQALEAKLKEQGQEKLLTSVEILGNVAKDMLVAQEIESRVVKPQASLLDLAQMTQSIFVSRKSLATNLGVNLKMNFMEQYRGNFTPTLSGGDYLYPSALTGPYFQVVTDPYWAKILIEKIIDLSLFLGASNKNTLVNIIISYDEKSVILELKCSCLLPPDFNFDTLFSQYYDGLSGKTVLSLGSGLEGFMAKNITGFLRVPLSVEVSGNPKILTFNLRFPKDLLNQHR